MVGALLTVLLAQGGGLLERTYPDQMIGLMPRFGAGVLAGSGTDKVSNPVGGWGGSLQIRLTDQIYLDISTDSRIPTATKEPVGGYLLGVNQQFAGVRLRQPMQPKVNLVFGAGGGAFAFVAYGDDDAENLATGPSAYGMAGIERQIYGSEGSGSYLGFEMVWTHYFAPEDAPMQGGLAEGRLTFSYYFGGSEAADCL